MKTSTVDIVLAGGESAVLDAAVDAVRQGRRVLAVLSTGDAHAAARFRRRCRAAAAADVQSRVNLASNLTVVTNAEVVCVDGIDAVEAVVIRGRRSGRLWGVNASAFQPCEAHRRK